jgi:hypothetical protein
MMGVLTTVARVTVIAAALTTAGHIHAGFNHDETSWLGIPQCQYDDYNGPHQPLCFTVDEAPGRHHLDIILLWSEGTHARELPVKYVIH